LAFSRVKLGAWLSVLLGFHLQALAASPVWKVETSDRQLYLAGSIHLLRAGDYPLPAAFERAYAHSDLVVLESDVSASGQPEFQQRLSQASRLPGGQRLDQHLSPAVWQRLVERFEQWGIDHDFVAHLRPAMAAMTLTLVELRHLGVNLGGVDQHFSQRARADGKTLRFLETLDQQLGFMTALDQENPDEILKQTLDEITRIETLFDLIMSHWRAGQVDDMERLLVTPMQQTFPRIHQQILVERNRAWMPQLEVFLESPVTELVIVGSAHLVGEEGLLNRLAQDGYRLTQLE
jgi:hypothetical protein